MGNTIDFKSLWSEAERIREDKLIKLGLFDSKVNANFLAKLMQSKFGWHENTVVVGIGMDDILRAKEAAVRDATKESR